MIAESNDTQAGRIFDSKLRTLRETVAYECDIRGIRRENVREELLQAATVNLWLACLNRPADGISCYWCFRKAYSRHRYHEHKHRGLTRLDDDGSAVDPVAAEASIKVDGVRLTVHDAMMDHPELCQLYETGETMAEAATRLGVCRERVRQVADKLGGVKFREWGGWRFPRGCDHRS